MHPPEPSTKTVHLLPRDSAIKRLCFDEKTQALRPNLVLVDRDGSVVFEINELGLKGQARDPARKLVAVWGDSVVFGIRWSWPCLLDEFAPGYQFLNGGIEGDPYANILRRATMFNGAQPVALNIVMLGWHPWQTPADLAKPRGTGWLRQLKQRLGVLSGSAATKPRHRQQGLLPVHRTLRADLLGYLEGARNTVLVTMPTTLNRNIVDRDLSVYFRAGDADTVFTFAGDLPYSLDLQRRMFEHISERNAIVRETAEAAGVCLVDLAAVFNTECVADFRRDFHDMVHLRPSAYRKAALAVYQGIKDLL